MQQTRRPRRRAHPLALLLLAACGSSPVVIQHEAAPAEAAGGEAMGFQLYTTDARLRDAALRARRRIADAIGDPGIALAEPDQAAGCQPFQRGCGFELSFSDVVYCAGAPDPALACTSQGVGGSTLGIEMQRALGGDELDNRLIHELFHVITRNRARHAPDGLFMEYSFGDERISAGTLQAVCEHFPCSRFVAEEDALSETAPEILLSDR